MCAPVGRFFKFSRLLSGVKLYYCRHLQGYCCRNNRQGPRDRLGRLQKAWEFMVPENADVVRAASNRASSRSPSGVAARRIRHEHLEREEAARETQRHARQPCKARAGEPTGRLAVVKLAVLLSGRLLDLDGGPHALSRSAGGNDIKSDVVATREIRFPTRPRPSIIPF